MRKEYNFSKAKRNPYQGKLKQQVTLYLDSIISTFFKKQSEESGIPYQTLINLYLLDCVKQDKKLEISWK